MLRVTEVGLLVCIVQLHATELVPDRGIDVQDPANKLPEHMVDRVLKVGSLYNTKLDKTVLAKAHSSLPLRHSVVRGSPSPISTSAFSAHGFSLPVTRTQGAMSHSMPNFHHCGERPCHLTMPPVLRKGPPKPHRQAAAATIEAPTISKAEPAQSARLTAHDASFEVVDGKLPLRIVSFNILAPCYHRLKVEGAERQDAETECTVTGNRDDAEVFFESLDEPRYVERNRQIIDILEATKADVILLQEFWVANERLKAMYLDRLGSEFEFIGLQRTSGLRKKQDGLACFVRKHKVIIQDSRDIVFNDCGVRVAKMLLLSLVPKDPSLPPQQLIVVNTHLLYPHDNASKHIRRCEVTKILGFVESYRRTMLCSTTSECSSSDVRLPVVMAGDFNGSPEGSVQSLLLEQRYQNAFVKHTKNLDWVSHKSHNSHIKPVDHIMFLNPSEQQLDKLGPIPDWTNLVYRELYKEIRDRYPTAWQGLNEVFKAADQNKTSSLSKDEFKNVLKTLGFIDTGPWDLTSEEVDLLVASADENGDGQIGFKEFLDRFSLAVFNRDKDYYSSTVNEVKSYAAFGRSGLPTTSSWRPTSTLDFKKRLNQARPSGDLAIKDARLYPSELEHGEWPDHWNLSDHGMVVVDFLCKVLPANDGQQSWRFPVALSSNEVH